MCQDRVVELTVRGYVFLGPGRVGNVRALVGGAAAAADATATVAVCTAKEGRNIASSSCI